MLDRGPAHPIIRAAGVLLAAGIVLGTAGCSSERGVSAPRTPIQHIVVLFQENISFDHYFGTYPQAANPPGEPAFNALPGTQTPNNYLSNPGLLTANPNRDNLGETVNPYRLDRSQAMTCYENNKYSTVQIAFDGNSTGTAAAMDKFIAADGVRGSSGCIWLPPTSKDPAAEAMSYVDGNTVTGLWNLANHFAMSDNFWQAAFGGSTRGAMNLIAGQTSNGSHPLSTNVVADNGAGGTCSTAPKSVEKKCTAKDYYSTTNNTVVGDADPLGDDCSSPVATQVRFSSSAGGGGGPLTIGDVLSAKNITWGWFQGGFAPTTPATNGKPAVCGSKHRNIAGNDAPDYVAHHEPFQYFPTTANPHHVTPTSPSQIGHNDTLGINHQYDTSSLFEALQSNVLPAVSFVKAPGYQDGHSGLKDSDPIDEQTWLAGTVNAIEHSKAWPSTAIVITYDDSDGWYDHAFHGVVNPSADAQYDFMNSSGKTTGSACGTPGAAPALRSPLAGDQDRCGPGARLPFVVISPWAKRNFIDHSFIDQSSVIKFIQENWGVGGLGGGAFESLSGVNAGGGQNPPGTPTSGDLRNLFDLNQAAPRAPAVFISPSMGVITSR